MRDEFTQADVAIGTFCLFPLAYFVCGIVSGLVFHAGPSTLSVLYAAAVCLTGVVVLLGLVEHLSGYSSAVLIDTLDSFLAEEGVCRLSRAQMEKLQGLIKARGAFVNKQAINWWTAAAVMLAWLVLFAVHEGLGLDLWGGAYDWG